MWFSIVWAVCFVAVVALNFKLHIYAIERHGWIGTLLVAVTLVFAPFFLLHDVGQRLLDRVFSHAENKDES